MKTLVTELKVGQKVKFKDAEVFVQGHKNGKAIVSKQPESPYTFSISHFSDKFEDFMNRVILVGF